MARRAHLRRGGARAPESRSLSAETLRDVAAVVAALGVLLLLVPLPGLRSVTAPRAAGLALVLVGWAGLLASLGSRAGLDAVGERLSSPLGAAAGAAGALVALAALVVAGRLVLRRPTAWFVLLALALPVRIPIGVAGEEQAKLLLPLYVVILVGLAAVVAERATGRLGPSEEGRTPIDVPLALFVAAVVLSTLWSADGGEAAVRAAFFYIPFTLLLLIAVALWPRARALPALAVTTIGLGVVVAVVALAQYATRDIWWNATLQQANVYSRLYRVNAIFFDPNILGRFLAIGIAAALAYAWVARRPRDLAALGAAVAVLSAGLVVTFSRSSALMLMTAAALMAIRAVGPRRALAVGGTLLVLAAAGSLAASDNVRRAATSAERLERVSEGRFELVRGGLVIWRREPVLGVGLGGFGTRFTQGLTPLERRRVRVVVSHNTPVTVLSEHGAVGLALFAALVVAAARRLGRGTRDDGARGWARWTALAVLAGILVHSLFYAALFEDPYTWVLAAAAAALMPVPRGPAPGHPSSAAGAPVPA